MTRACIVTTEADGPSLTLAHRRLTRIERNSSPSLAAEAALACAAAYNAGWYAAQRDSEYTNPFLDTRETGDTQ